MSYLDLKHSKPNLELELKSYRENKNSFFVGVDEVGRGSLAGPIVACACWVNPEEFNNLPLNIKDSKKLSYKNRIEVFQKSKNVCIASTAVSSSYEIDKYGLTLSNNLAIHRSLYCLLNNLNIKFLKNNNIFSIHLDGNILPDFSKNNNVNTPLPELPKNTITTVIKGDDKVLSISLASIIAKVIRDSLMEKYDKKYPMYDFKNNVGYGTKHHLQIIKSFGICNIHRKTFKPVNTIYS